MIQNPDKCSMLDCPNELGPDALVFEHKGKAAGGICEVCIGESKSIRVVFKEQDDGIFEPTEMVQVGRGVS